MATAAAISALLKSRLGANTSDDVVAVVMRQIDHLRMLISAIESSMPEVGNAHDFLYREIERKLTTKSTSSWAKLEGFICTIVDAACSPISGLFPRDIRRAVREYYEGSFFSTLSLLFDILHGNVPDVSWKALALQQELVGTAQRTGFFAGPMAARSPAKSKSPKPASQSPRAGAPSPFSRATRTPPRTPSGLSWFIPAADSDDELPSGRRSSRDHNPEDEEPLRRESLNRSSPILPRISTKQLRSISQLTADSESSSPWPRPRESGGSRQPAERAESSRDKIASTKRSSISPQFESMSPFRTNESGDRGISAGKSRSNTIQSEFRTPPSGEPVVSSEKPFPLARRTLNLDDDQEEIQRPISNKSSRLAISSTSLSSLESFSVPKDESDQIEQQERLEVLSTSNQSADESEEVVNEQKTELPSESREIKQTQESKQESSTGRPSVVSSASESTLPDPVDLSNRLSMLEEELSNAKGRGVEFSDRLQKAQSTISTLLENGTNAQNLLTQLEQESNNLMNEMERFQDQGDTFFQNFESIRQDIRKLQQNADQISTLRGVLAHTRSELASEREKNLRAERELAELRDQMQINELTSQFDYMESSARQLESQANIMQMLLQQTRRQLDAVRTTAAEAYRIESEIEEAIREHDLVARNYQKTCQDVSRLRARLMSMTAIMVDSSTQYEL